MPIDCSAITNAEERAHCILIQNRRASLAAIDTSVPEGCGTALSVHLKNFAHHVGNAHHSLAAAERANAGID